MIIERWFNETVDLIKNSLGNSLHSIDYKSLLFVFYNHMSNRNLAKLIAYLYEKNQTDIYFEIDNIIVTENYNKDEVSRIIEKLNQNGFQEWITQE